MKIVVWVTTSCRMGADGVSNNLQFPYEVEAHGIDHLFFMLRADGAVMGDKLKLRATPQATVKELVERQPTILTMAGVAMIQEPRFRIVEVDYGEATGTEVAS